jgi:molybdopterin synthase catalytic subunit
MLQPSIHVHVTENAIDPDEVMAVVRNPDAGSNLLFLGTTRKFTGEVETVELRYECYEGMARREMRGLCLQAADRWDLYGVALVHRIGIVIPGEASLAVAVSSAHRKASFEAAEWLIDEVKRVVPVWKQEISPDGETHWVHPGTPRSGDA